LSRWRFVQVSCASFVLVEVVVSVAVIQRVSPICFINRTVIGCRHYHSVMVLSIHLDGHCIFWCWNTCFVRVIGLCRAGSTRHSVSVHSPVAKTESDPASLMSRYNPNIISSAAGCGCRNLNKCLCIGLLYAWFRLCF
jgi:hypothetical protein